MNLLQMLRLHGQSVWLSCFDHELVVSGQLQQYLDNEVRGVISNFSSLERSLHTLRYDADFQSIAHPMETLPLYNTILVREIQLAAERLKEIHDQTGGKDGYVNLDLPPHVVSNTESMLSEARRLWRQIGWSNLMLNIPVAPENQLVIEQLIGEGINVNITQVVSLKDYVQVTDAYLTGLEAFAAQNGAISKVASVASVSVSCLDAAIPTVGVAQAKMLYQQYRNLYRNSNICSLARRWQTLAEQGAHPQRLVWVLADCGIGSRTQHYVESLMGANTVIVLSPFQLAIPYKDNDLRSSLTEHLESAEQILTNLSQAGIDIDQVAQQLRLDEQVRSQLSFEQLLQAIKQKQQAVRYFD